jgi:hypothetical protein
MAEEVPIHEVRRVVIEYEIRVPRGAAATMMRPDEKPEKSIADLAEAVRRELLRTSSRNGNVGLS